jgi:hypothetical protein
VPSLLDKRLIFVTGKGGVGKTVAAAAIARAAARRGRRVLLVEVDSDTSMGRLFGAADITFEPRPVADRIWACNLERERSIKEFVKRWVRSKRIADAVLSNNVISVFFDSAPSVAEGIMLDHLAEVMSEQKFDLAVVDLPASGHAITLLSVPRSMARMIRVGDLAKRMGWLADQIAHPRDAALVFVTLPEEMPVRETIDLYAKAKKGCETRVAAVIVNGVRRPALQLPDLDRVTEVVEARGGGEVLDRVRDAVSVGLHWLAEDRENLATLHAELPVPAVEVPFLFHKADEAELVEHVSRALGTLEVP